MASRPQRSSRQRSGSVERRDPDRDRRWPIAGDLDEAYASAAAAQRDWAARLPDDRAERSAAPPTDVLAQRRDEIVGWLVRESGGTLAKAQLECDLVEAGLLRGGLDPASRRGPDPALDVPGKENRVYRLPVGVVAVISPWNFPMQLSNRSVAPALAVGNGVVLKPAGDTPVTGGLLLASISRRPAARRPAQRRRRRRLADRRRHRRAPGAPCRVVHRVDAGGARDRREGRVKRLALELGGNGPMVVLDDADLELAVDAAVFGIVLPPGPDLHDRQPRRRRRRRARRVRRAARRAGGASCTSATPPTRDSDLGPIINDGQLASIQDKLARARDAGAEQLLGGEPSGPTGLSLPPHVLWAPTRSPPPARRCSAPSSP